MSEIEAELVKLLKFKKAPEDYEDRQEYLEAITQTVDKIKDDAVFDAMTEPAYDWLQEAVESHNKKREIPDFPDAEPMEEEVEEGVEDEPEAGPEVDEEEIEETVEEEAEAEDGQTDEETVEEEAGETTEAGGEEVVTVVPESASEPTPEPTSEEAPAKKPRKPRKGSGGRYLKKKKGKPDIQPKNKPGHEPNYKKITGTKNRYGMTEGTKRDLALKMLEKGCTMRDVNIELGDNYYVMLRRLHKEGHLIEKLENRVIKITHKDDLPKKKGK